MPIFGENSRQVGGSYVVTVMPHLGAYHPMTPDRVEDPYLWNADLLICYYP
jgi:hypothetical protein